MLDATSDDLPACVLEDGGVDLVLLQVNLNLKLDLNVSVVSADRRARDAIRPSAGGKASS